MPGMYDTYELNRTVERLRTVPTLFLDTFFPEVSLSEKEEIYFDIVDNKPRIAPFVHPLREGRVVETEGYDTKSFKPAYIKDKRIHDPFKAIKRRAGEAIGGTLTQDQRMQLNLLTDLQSQRDMLTRRLEIMAAEAIRLGRQTVVGDGINAVVNFGRDAALTVALTTTDRWNDAGQTRQTDFFETWNQLILDRSGVNATVIIMDVGAWNLLKRDTRLDKLLDRNYRGSNATVDMEPRFRVEGAQYKGRLGDYELWVYSHPFIDPATGLMTNIMPANTVIMASPTGVEGVRHFGAIMDLKAGLQPREQFVKSWEQEDPSVRFLLSQSAPLMVPYRTNATLVATVV